MRVDDRLRLDNCPFKPALRAVRINQSGKRVLAENELTDHEVFTVLDRYAQAHGVLSVAQGEGDAPAFILISGRVPSAVLDAAVQALGKLEGGEG